MSDNGRIIIRHYIWPIFIVFTGLIVLWLAIWSTQKYDPAKELGQLIDELNAVHAVIYLDASTESQQQFNEFAPYTNLLTFVRCDENETFCKNESIEEVPTIKLSDLGIDLTGLQKKEDLIALFDQINI